MYFKKDGETIMSGFSLDEDYTRKYLKLKGEQ